MFECNHDAPISIPIAALQAYSFCPRQCSLIYNEQIFDENIYTLRGKREHELVHEEGSEIRGQTHLIRGLRIFEDVLGIHGVADMVEITYRDDKVSHIFPVEYKYGKRKQADHDDIQLAAQVLCLEYMFKIEISQGAIYHISSRHRREVEIDRNLRSKLLHVVNEVRLLFSQKHSPAPAADQRCRHCAQSDSCLPFAAQKLHPNNYL